MIKVLLITTALICTFNADPYIPSGLFPGLPCDPRHSPNCPDPLNEECVKRIYQDCNFPTVFTDEELENVRQYLNYSFTVLADIKPDKPLCPKLTVRQDWKCLSPEQKDNITKVWKIMYEKGDIQRLTDLHVKTWPAWHKSPEFLPSHRWFINEFETIMKSYDPSTFLPYWDPGTYAVQPERSSVWDVLGHSGNYSDGYSVQDGIYSDLRLIPTMKRHWINDAHIIPWFSQEYLTSGIQTANSYGDVILLALGAHFPPHLHIGGYEGQYSYREAPYDCLFYMHHLAQADVTIFRWQLKDKAFLTPLSYNVNFKVFDQATGEPRIPDILTDTLTGVPGVRIKELFWMGFGDLCSIPDQLVKPISNLWKGINDPIPTVVKLLPKWIIKKYFPVFYSGNFSAVLHTFEEVGDCNSVCHPLPEPTFMRGTEQGNLQFEAYYYDNHVDLTNYIRMSEKRLYHLWIDLNHARYCSPYVTTY